MPPGIDEPSLPALPDFGNHHQRFRSPALPPLTQHQPAHSPPSFDASEAAQAVGGVAISRDGAGVGAGAMGEAPPGYFRTSPVIGGQGGPPAYS